MSITSSLGLLVLLWPMLSTAATYTMSPSGPPFAQMITQLQPGDTLVLQPGTYTDATSGDLDINCTAGARHGTASQRITIRAEPERQALIVGTGAGVTVSLRSCHYWTLEGLHVRGVDAPVPGDYAPALVDIQESSHITLRRILVHQGNRHLNNALVLLLHTSQSLVEESELYSFHRHGLNTKYGSQNTFRRNYVHSRGYGDVPGGYPSNPTDRGDSGFVIYPGSHHVLENNISEGNGIGVSLQAFEAATHNRILGHMSLRDDYGTVLRARGDTATTMPQQTTIQGMVVIQPSTVGVYARGAKETRCVNCSVFGGQQGLVADQMETYPGDGAPSFFAENPLVVQAAHIGVNMVAQASWQIDSPNMFSNGTNFSPNVGEPKITNISTMDPGLGSCYVYIPNGSPMKGRGQGGADIGANVVYRYQDGVLTGVPLWGLGGQFPCGAVVPGVNDVGGQSCRDVHERLHVNTHGCVVPTGQGPHPPAAGPLPAPTAFRLVMP